ncbi:MAG: hypothetical protein EOO73_16280 [Myxococcales bacterium]|nr:MAG: hypothetical protein EOO73_16280 [Myxococcales bacterium]
MRRPTWASFTSGVAVVAVAASASAAEPAPVQVELSCRPEAAPGRVLCELSYRAAVGRRLAWADALVLRAPEFARPLRSRVTPERSRGAEPGERKVSLAFVALVSGVGQVTVRARSVICHGQGEQESCRPHSQNLTAELRVGS